MEVITFVEGNVPSSKREEFESAYEVLKGNPKPEGLIASYLLQDVNNGLYIIETVWKSQESLDKMRSEGKPAAIKLFDKAGVKPILKAYNMKNNI